MKARRAFDWTRDPITVRIVTDLSGFTPGGLMGAERIPATAVRVRVETPENTNVVLTWGRRKVPLVLPPDSVTHFTLEDGEGIAIMSQQKEKRRIKRMKKAVKRARGEANAKHTQNVNTKARLGKAKKGRAFGRRVPRAASSRKARKRAR